MCEGQDTLNIDQKVLQHYRHQTGTEVILHLMERPPNSVIYDSYNLSLHKDLSLPELREPFYVSICFGQGVIWVGILCSVFYVFVFLCFGRVWFSIRDICLSLSLIGNHT